MSKTPWTKGVWYVTETLEGEFRVRQLSSDAVIASIEDGGHYDEELIKWDERGANARLIAQAPAMAELLQEALSDINSANTVEWEDRVYAVLAAARGEHLKPEASE